MGAEVTYPAETAAGNRNRVADEQAALRRVATLAAAGASAAELCAAVASEVAQLHDVDAVLLSRFGPGATFTVLASALRDGSLDIFPLGSTWPLDGPGVSAAVFKTGRPARVDDYSELTGTVADRIRESPGQSSVGVPIVVDGSAWGAICVGTMGRERLPDDTEARLSDFTELIDIAISNAQARADLRRVADEQAALRRVATLVAQGAAPHAVFTTVLEETGRLIGARIAALARFTPEGLNEAIAGWSERGDIIAPGTRLPLDGRSVNALVKKTGAPARVDDYEDAPGAIAERLRELGIRSAVGAPVVVDGAVWGALMLSSDTEEQFPAGTELRLASFAELVATAISNTAAHQAVHELAAEQAALRRVATLAAQGAEPRTVVAAVCEEIGLLLGASNAALARFTPDGMFESVSGWSLRVQPIPAGERLPLDGHSVSALIRRTGAPARMDSFEGAPGPIAERMRALGIRSAVGAPVVVDGAVWGALILASDTADPFAPETEFRVASFAELVATAISNSANRAELLASRARIVAAGDEARRRIERNLHDGTQQRLIALGLDLQRIRATITDDRRDQHSALDQIERDVESILEDVREVSRGLHPALLARGGLSPALRALTRRSPIPVEVHIDLAGRPPAPIETALYYVIAEALTNAIKHSQASAVTITIEADEVALYATIADDGVGGAQTNEGSGLIGAVDRVDALAGRFRLESQPGQGTTIAIELPAKGDDARAT
jgi:signal transduction histidine kinase